MQFCIVGKNTFFSCFLLSDYLLYFISILFFTVVMGIIYYTLSLIFIPFKVIKLVY